MEKWRSRRKGKKEEEGEIDRLGEIMEKGEQASHKKKHQLEEEAGYTYNNRKP